MISVAMATYNGEKYLPVQLDSILNQTIQDFEIVICDDCSKDNTRKILEDYARLDSRIKVYLNETNLGFKKNFEKAISLCSGDYVALSDQDDIWLPEKLEKSLMCIESTGVDLVCTNALLVDGEGKSLGSTMMKDVLAFDYVSENPDNQLMYLCQKTIVQGSTVLAKKAFVQSCLPIPDSFKFHDKWLGLKAACTKGIRYVTDETLLYRQHGSNQTTNDTRNIFTDLKVTKTTARDLENEAQVESDLKYVLDNFELNENQKKIVSDSYEYLTVHLKKKDWKYFSYFAKNYDNLTFQKSAVKKAIVLTKKFLGMFIRIKKKIHG